MSNNTSKSAKEIQCAFESAVAAQQAGNLVLAEEAYRKVLALAAAHAGALTNLASLLRRRGDRDGAVNLMERAAEDPDAPAPFWFNYGNLLRELDRIEHAEQAYRRALRLDPRLHQAATRLARLVERHQPNDEAIVLHRQALAIEPRNAASLRGLGQLHFERGELEEAERCYRAALALAPDHPVTLNALGVVIKDRGQLDDALALWRRAIELAPEFAVAHNNLGAMLRLMRRPQDALVPLRTALRLNPRDSMAAGNLAHAFLNLGQTTEAEEIARGILQHDSTNAEGHLMLGFSLAYQGRVEESITEFLRSLEAAPGTTTNICNTLFASLYTDQRSAAMVSALHRSLASQIPAAVPRYHAWTCTAQSSERLRIGYLSPDLREHPVSTFFEPVIAHHDRDKVEIHCFSTTEAPDAMTPRLRRHAAVWHECAGRPDPWIAQRIVDSGIHILVDLAGHTSGNRAGVLRAKPAPIQALYIGYPSTSGIPEVDYLIADRRVCPPHEAALYSEQVAYLEGSFWCFGAPDFAPLPAPAPVLRNGFVTFGSYNAAQKICDSTVRLWSRVILAVPNSRLVLKSFSFADDKLRARFQQRFVDAGIDADRVDMVPPNNRKHFYAEYRHLDIALDPIPYNGGTTTCEALWMGVPVIARRGELFRGRMAAAILEIIGLPELVADSDDDYVAVAAGLAQDVARITALHERLREQVKRSPLCDAPRAARELEALYRTMWWAQSSVV